MALIHCSGLGHICLNNSKLRFHSICDVYRDNRLYSGLLGSGKTLIVAGMVVIGGYRQLSGECYGRFH